MTRLPDTSIYLLLDADAAPRASFNFLAQSWQHTSTVFPPIFTLIRFASSLQSQAAQVFATMTPPFLVPEVQLEAVSHARGNERCQNL
jgi:hypothetical protein